MKTKNEQRRFFYRILTDFLMIAIFGLAFQTTFAQAGQSELTGVVSDANGGAIPAAQVVLTEIATGQTAETNTDENGAFVFTNKKPGIYSIKFTANGFNTLIREGVTLTTGERIRVDQELPVATGQETVVVNADAPLLHSETSSLGQVIDNRKVVDLPLNGRSFFSLVGLAAGIAQPIRTTEGASLPRINGGRPRTNEYLFVIKRTNLTETTNVEFRTEIFNLTNTPPLGSPNTSFGSAAFGTITSAGDPRVIQFAVKLNFWIRLECRRTGEILNGKL